MSQTLADLIVIFGGTGDLAQRMLFPSLYFLDADGFLVPEFRIVAAARAVTAAAPQAELLGVDREPEIDAAVVVARDSGRQAATQLAEHLARPRVHQHDVERLERVADAREFGLGADDRGR